MVYVYTPSLRPWSRPGLGDGGGHVGVEWGVSGSYRVTPRPRLLGNMLGGGSIGEQLEATQSYSEWPEVTRDHSKRAEATRGHSEPLGVARRQGGVGMTWG